MEKLYSKTTGACYIPGLHKDFPKDAVPIDDERYENVIANPPLGKIRSHDADGLPVLIDPHPPSLAELAVTKRSELEKARDTAFTIGLEYDINGDPDVVQTRPQDQINLLGLNAKATRLITTGNADTLMEFRGGSNISHWLNAAAMDDLTMAALSHIENIYQQSWERKDALDAALKAQDREAIEALSW